MEESRELAKEDGLPLASLRLKDAMGMSVASNPVSIQSHDSRQGGKGEPSKLPFKANAIGQLDVWLGFVFQVSSKLPSFLVGSS